LREAQFFAGNFADGLRVGLQILNVLRQRGVFLVQPVEHAADFLNLLLFTMHGQEAVCAEDIVNEKDDDENGEQVSPIGVQQFPGFLFPVNLPLPRVRILLHPQDAAVQLFFQVVSKSPRPHWEWCLPSVRRNVDVFTGGKSQVGNVGAPTFFGQLPKK